MLPFFSAPKLRREQVAGRALVTAAALLFLVIALLRSLPSRDEIFAFLERSALAGYESTAETTPTRPSVLEEFYDTPAVPAPVTSDEAKTNPDKPKFTLSEQTAL